MRRREAARRIRLRDGLTVLWRERGAVQVGTGPQRVVLVRLTDDEQALLDDLGDGPTLSELVRGGQARGVPEERVHALVATLDRGGVLAPGESDADRSPRGAESWAARAVDAAYWGRLRPDGDGRAVVAGRGTRVVGVLGVDRLGMLVATGLAAAGVGTVLLADDAPVTPRDEGPGGFGAADLDGRRDDAGAQVLRTLVPAVRTSAPPGTRPDLCVLVEHGVANPVRSRPLVREDIAHLSVVVADVDVVVGPLVVPGSGPCLRCLDLHRCDEDERWPAVATQVAARPEAGVESSLAPLAAALAVSEALAHLDDRPTTTRGTTLAVDATRTAPRLRRWAAHPECGCVEVAPTARERTGAAVPEPVP